MKLSCVFVTWALYICPVVLLAAQMLLAASLETLQCEGPASTGKNSCHTNHNEDDDDQDDSTRSMEVSYTFSEPFHLIVSYDWLILQGPAAPIFEGDPLVLHCRAWQDWPLTQVTFYHDGLAIGPPGPNKEFSIAAVQESDSGHYHCSGIFQSPSPGSPETASPVAITVHELFPAPVLRASPSVEPQEGSSVTLSCETKLPLQRSAARLLFSFFKDGKTVCSRAVSSELQIPAASVQHSGFYWCEAVTEDSQVWKQSPQLKIRVQAPSSSAAPQKPAAPKTPTEPPGPLPPLPTSSSEMPSFSSPDPHLHHQMRILLKYLQDVKILLGHLVMELRDLSSRPRPGTTKVADK